MNCKICGGEMEDHTQKDRWHPTNLRRCKDCYAQQRHEMLFENVKPRGRLLHCSPDKCLEKIWRYKCDYVSADYIMRDDCGVSMADIKYDLTKTPFKDKEFDVIVLSHVIDAIKEEDLAIKELHRILKDDGTIYLINPMYDNELSQELKEPEYYHWRRCGSDYWERYKELFIVSLIKEEETLAIMTKYEV